MKKSHRIWLALPHEEKDEAINAHPRLDDGQNAIVWDKELRLWYARPGVELNNFERWLPHPHDLSMNSDDPVSEFAQVLEGAGLVLKGLPVMDGTLQRVPTKQDKKGSQSGVYKGFMDGRPAGWYRDYRSSDQHPTKWTFSGGEKMDPQASLHLRAHAQQTREDKARELENQYNSKAAYATRYISSLPQAIASEYLTRKGVQAAPGVRINPKGELVIPFSNAKGNIRSYQRVPPTGGKDARILKDSEKTGNWFTFGNPVNGQPLLFAEGYSTSASIHEATGLPVLMTVDAGNMISVAQNARAVWPDSRFIFCADNDHLLKNPKTGEPENKGILSAQKAAELTNGEVIAPSFTPSELAQQLTDFNDLDVSRGREIFQHVMNTQLLSIGIQTSFSNAPQIRDALSLGGFVFTPVQETTMDKQESPEITQTSDNRTPRPNTVSDLTDVTAAEKPAPEAPSLSPKAPASQEAVHKTITLYHGSPATFSAIDSEKIGLGQNFVGKGFYTDTSVLGVHYAMEEINHKNYHVYELEIPSNAVILDRWDISTLTDELRERIREAGKTGHQLLKENGDISRSEIGNRLADSEKIDDTFLKFASSPHGMSILKEAGIAAIKDDSYVAIVNTDLINNIRLRSAGGNIKAEMTQYIEKALVDVAHDSSRLSNILRAEPGLSIHYDAIRSELINLGMAQNRPDEAERLTSLLTHTFVETIESNPDRKTSITPLNRLYAETIRSLDLNHDNSSAALGHIIDSAVVNISPDQKLIPEPNKPEPAHSQSDDLSAASTPILDTRSLQEYERDIQREGKQITAEIQEIQKDANNLTPGASEKRPSPVLQATAAIDTEITPPSPEGVISAIGVTETNRTADVFKQTTPNTGEDKENEYTTKVITDINRAEKNDVDPFPSATTSPSESIPTAQNEIGSEIHVGTQDEELKISASPVLDSTEKSIPGALETRHTPALQATVAIDTEIPPPSPEGAISEIGVTESNRTADVFKQTAPNTGEDKENEAPDLTLKSTAQEKPNVSTSPPEVETDAIIYGPRRPDAPQREDLEKIIKGLTSEALSNNKVLYRLDAQDAFHDLGNRLEMCNGASQDDRKVLAALAVASKFYGGVIELTGSAEFKEKAMRLIIDYDLDIRMKIPAQRAQFEELRKQMGATQDAVVTHMPTPDLNRHTPLNEQEKAPQVTPSAENVAPVTQTGALAIPQSQIPPAPLGSSPDVPLPPPRIAELSHPVSQGPVDTPVPRAPAMPGSDAIQVSKMPEEPAPATLSPGESVTAVLMNYGEAMYENKDQRGNSFFVELQNRGGSHTYWGQDLRKLVENHKAGDVVTLTLNSRDVWSLPNEDKERVKNNWSLIAASTGIAVSHSRPEQGQQLLSFPVDTFGKLTQQIRQAWPDYVSDLKLPPRFEDRQFYFGEDRHPIMAPQAAASAIPPSHDAPAALTPVMASVDHQTNRMDLVLVQSAGQHLQGLVRLNDALYPALATPTTDNQQLVISAITDMGPRFAGYGQAVNFEPDGTTRAAPQLMTFHLKGREEEPLPAKLYTPEKQDDALFQRLGFEQTWKQWDDTRKPEDRQEKVLHQERSHSPGR